MSRHAAACRDKRLCVPRAKPQTSHIHIHIHIHAKAKAKVTAKPARPVRALFSCVQMPLRIHRLQSAEASPYRSLTRQAGN